MERKNYKISQEVFKFPYNGNFEKNDNEMFSEKFRCCTIKIRKKIIKGIRWSIFYLEVSVSVVNGVIPSQAIGLLIPPQTPAIMRSIHSNADLSKQAIIAQVIQQMPAEIDFTQKEINELYYLSVECKNNSLSKEELITKITNLRSGSFVDVAAGLAIIAAIILLANNANGFQPNPHVNVPPHLQWLYGNNYQPGQFGYGKGVGPRSITVTGMTQNAGSEKKYPSSGSWDYKEVMRELDRQSSKKRIYVQVGDQIYILKNPYHEGPYELGDKLADQIYESIRESDTDICDIAQNLGFKADNIKNVKDHVFYNEHDLDRYGPDQIERKQFDPNLQQALAWKRLETGTHTQDDVTWIKHECAERHHELKYGSGYNEAHNRAQTRFDGAPWENQF
jgi:hypothetical protein